MAKLSLKGALFILCVVSLASVLVVIVRFAIHKNSTPIKFIVGRLGTRNSPWTIQPSGTWKEKEVLARRKELLSARKNKNEGWISKSPKRSYKNTGKYSKYAFAERGRKISDTMVDNPMDLDKRSVLMEKIYLQRGSNLKWQRKGLTKENKPGNIDNKQFNFKRLKNTSSIGMQRSSYFPDPSLKESNAITKNRTYSSEEFISFSGSSYLKRRFPKIMIVGFGKAGTKALFEVLKTSPDLIGPEKETRFFTKRYTDKITDYLRSFPYPRIDQVVIEKSPDYIIDASVPNRIAKFAGMLNISLNELKFIVVLRDPIERAVSEHLEWKITRMLQHAAELEPFPVMAMTKNGEVNKNQHFIKASNYVFHITRWLQFFNTSKTCFVDGDRFAKAPFPEIKLLEECLGLKSYFKSGDFIYNESTGFYCFRTMFDKLCMNKSKGRKHPRIPAEVKAKLKDYFGTMRDDLFQIIGRELAWPNFRTGN